MPKRVAIVGAGWAGASAARALADAGVHVEVFESAAVVGGHSRAEVLQGVVYEPNGPHIFHTDDERVAGWVDRFGMRRPFDFRPRTRLVLDGEERLLAWPLRLDELRALPDWPRIDRELGERPALPDPSNFETWCVSLLGETLYRWFVYGYTVKQWGCEPSRLSSRFAPKRVELRENGHHGAEARAALAWRGIAVVARFHDTEELDATRTPAYAINEPRLEVPYTRTVETKHATGQRVRGTVVCEEYPGADARHYPVHTPERTWERENERLQELIRRASPRPVTFCGRLASYRYLNQDEAILEGLRAADAILAG
jgi:UDP-galactopyranose mutase